MNRIYIQEKSRTIWAVIVVAVVFVGTLFAGIAFGATPTNAQSRGVIAQSFEIPAPRAPRAPTPPLGYGGGPRAPRPPDLAGRLGPIFQRILSFLNGLFGA